jgi:hypothetical protein
MEAMMAEMQSVLRQAQEAQGLLLQFGKLFLDKEICQTMHEESASFAEVQLRWRRMQVCCHAAPTLYIA